jgi:AbiV family abortive infection protein
MKNSLNQYTGFLTPSQTAKGINAAAANAKRLADDAKILYDAGRFPSAASLAILALEELGKISILRQSLLANSKTDLAECWRRYRRHTEKNYLTLLPDLLRLGARKLDDFKSIFTNESQSDRATYDTVKQLGFYTDCCGAAHWSIPSEVIDQGLAGLLLALATALATNKESVTVDELLLWKIHMRNGIGAENLLKWCSAMIVAGLKPPEYLEEMRQFIQQSEA